jgi:hypothetical protein
MKKMKVMLAAISMMVLLFCGSEAQAQHMLVGGQNLNVKNLVDLSTVDLLNSDQANEVLLAEYGNLDKSINANKVTLGFYKALIRDMQSGKSVENALIDNRDLIAIYAAKTQDNTINLENIYNDTVELLEN